MSQCRFQVIILATLQFYILLRISLFFTKQISGPLPAHFSLEHNQLKQKLVSRSKQTTRAESGVASNSASSDLQDGLDFLADLTQRETKVSSEERISVANFLQLPPLERLRHKAFGASLVLCLDHGSLCPDCNEILGTICHEGHLFGQGFSTDGISGKAPPQTEGLV